ncbi:hypothetical protein PM082_012074 [Marasmius tenuissimus]|nr:hypothetical protein PM082_012074 [Marasmius tenuissimus]
MLSPRAESQSSLLENYRISLVILPALEILIPVFLYGVYAVLYGICMMVLRRKKTRYHLRYMIAMSTLFTLGTAGIVLTAISVIEYGYRNLKNVMVLEEVDYLSPSFIPTMRVFFCTYVLSNFVAHAILISRCFIVWGRRLRIIVIPAILSVACNAAGLVTAATAEHFRPVGSYSMFSLRATGGTPLLIAFIATDLFINILLTLMLAGRIFAITRTTREILGSNVRTMYYSLVVVIIESGMLYPITLILLPALASTAGSNVVAFSLVQIVGITPTLVIVRVGLGNHVEDVQSCLETMRAASYPDETTLESTGLREDCIPQYQVFRAVASRES